MHIFKKGDIVKILNLYLTSSGFIDGEGVYLSKSSGSSFKGYHRIETENGIMNISEDRLEALDEKES